MQTPRVDLRVDTCKPSVSTGGSYMPIQHAVLALLVDGPGHGYELKGAFEAAVGPQWGPLNIGHLYQVLDRLSRDGLVTSSRVAQQIKPDRVVYQITTAGRSELAAW